MCRVPDDETDLERRLNDAFAKYLRHADNEDDVDIDELTTEDADVRGELKLLLETAGLLERIAGPTLASDSDRQSAQASECRRAASTDGVNPGLTETIAFRQELDAGTSGSAGSAETQCQYQSFGDYELFEIIGRGGMGVVYKARQLSLDRTVAVKMIRSGVLASESDISRFYNEAQAAGRLRHPNIVQVHQVGEFEGQHFFSMEFIAGTDLAQLIHREPLEPCRIARYLKTVAEAIQLAHENHIIHRDLKPANILIDSNDQPFVTDFGLAKDFDQDHGLTSTGASLGTPAYMSPEQAAGKVREVGVVTDIYSLGAILYELLTGRPPFRADSTIETILEVIHKEPVSPKAVKPDVDAQLAAVCMKCLNKEPSKRYTSAQELAYDLSRYLEGNHVLARRSGVLSQCWRWSHDVPIVAAFVGRRVTNPTIRHKVAQWMTVVASAVALVVILFVLIRVGGERPFPSRIRIASGKPSGEYYEFGKAFGEVLDHQLGIPVDVIATSGAIENRDQLLADNANVALLQASAVSSGQLAVVTPLYRESLYFIVREDVDVNCVDDLSGKTVVIGEHGSGMQVSARLAVRKLQLTVTPVAADFAEMIEHPEWHAAIVTTGQQNSALLSLLANTQLRLLSLSEDEVMRLTGPVFQPHTIKAGSRGQRITDSNRTLGTEIRTVTTTTFLVVHKTTSSDFVNALLEAVFGDTELAAMFQLIPREESADWPALPLHSAAEEFFHRKRQQ